MDDTASEHQHDHRPGHHHHDHPHGPGHDHAPLSAAEHQARHARPQTVAIEEAILAKNDHLAEHNRVWLADRGVTAFNLMSSPGSGRTSLLERTIAELSAERRIFDRAGPRAPDPLGIKGGLLVALDDINTGAHLGVERADGPLHLGASR